jgi:putative toxin-antitoxin system antitoxin component (TIGR02293 family)
MHMADNRRQMAYNELDMPLTTQRRTIETVRKGFPAARLDKMLAILSVERSLLLAILGLSERTLQRKQQSSGRLSPAASDRLARLDRILALAVDVFGDKEKAVKWLKRSNRALGNEMPLRLLDTDAGTQSVERELRQVEHGFVY